MLLQLKLRDERRFAGLASDEVAGVLPLVDCQRVFLPEPSRASLEVACERRIFSMNSKVVVKVVSAE